MEAPNRNRRDLVGSAPRPRVAIFRMGATVARDGMGDRFRLARRDHRERAKGTNLRSCARSAVPPARDGSASGLSVSIGRGAGILGRSANGRLARTDAAKSPADFREIRDSRGSMALAASMHRALEEHPGTAPARTMGATARRQLGERRERSVLPAGGTRRLELAERAPCGEDDQRHERCQGPEQALDHDVPRDRCEYQGHAWKLTPCDGGFRKVRANSDAPGIRIP